MTKGNFSKTPADVLADALKNGYVGLHVEQGVPVLDRDLNLLADLIAARLETVVSRHIGDGTAGDSDFLIQTNGKDNDFTIRAGTYMVGGAHVVLDKDISYTAQSLLTAIGTVPPLTTPPAARIDTVYLDVWREEVDDTDERDLGNPDDVGMRTSTRTQMRFAVRVAEGASSPPNPRDGHTQCVVATLNRSPGVAVPGSGTPPENNIIDRRNSSFSLTEAFARLSDFQKQFLPVVTSVPSRMAAGQESLGLIKGKNLSIGNVQIALAGVIITPEKGGDDTAIEFRLPITAREGRTTVSVRNGFGTASPIQTTLIDPPTPLAFQPQGQPQFDPPSLPATGPVTLKGTNFSGVDTVTFNATPPVSVKAGAFTTANATEIKLTVPASVPPGAMTVTVSAQANPPLNATSTDKLTVTAASNPPAVPTVGSPQPRTQQIGSEVTITGTNLGTGAGTSVTFDGTPPVRALASDIVNVTPTAIRVKVPAGLGPQVTPPSIQVTITVTVNGISATSAGKLTVTRA